LKCAANTTEAKVTKVGVE